MKLGKIVKTTALGKEENIIEVDGWQILIGLISAGLITGLISAFSLFLIQIPTSNFDKRKEISNQNFEILNFIFRSKSDTIRRNSLLFMLRSGTLIDENGEIMKVALDSLIPDWSKMPDFKRTIKNDLIAPDDSNQCKYQKSVEDKK